MFNPADPNQPRVKRVGIQILPGVKFKFLPLLISRVTALFEG